MDTGLMFQRTQGLSSHVDSQLTDTELTIFLLIYQPHGDQKPACEP